MLALVLEKKSVKLKLLTAMLAVVASVALPQIFHGIGIISSTGPLAGKIFLPMHIPVIISGFLAGPIVGLAAAILSPIISFAISGMPAINILGFVMMELAGYGITAGMLKKANMPVFIKLLVVQIVGRLLRTLALVSAVYIFGFKAIIVTEILNMVTVGLFGIVLQWALIPLFLYRIKGFEKHYGQFATFKKNI